MIYRADADEPGPDTLCFEVLTLDQMRQIITCIEQVVGATGFGSVTITIENHHPRRVQIMISDTLAKTAGE